VSTRVVADEGRTQVIEDDLGFVRRVRTDGPSMPQFLRFPVESRADWERKIKPRLDPSAHDRSILDREVAALPPGEHPVGFWAVGLYAFWRNFWGEEKLAFAFYDAPDVLHEMAATWLRMHCECSPPVFERVRVDWTLFHEDMACKGGPLIGPKMFREFMTPYYRDLFAHLRRCGQSRFVVDSDGYNGAVFDCFVELGVRALYPFEVAAGNDTFEIRRQYPEVLIWVGIDKRVLLKGKEAVRREVMDKVPALWEKGGFIPSIDHAVPPCPQANFEYFLELVRGLF